MKWITASGISLHLSRLGFAEQPGFAARETLPGRQSWNPAANGAGRVDGVAKVTGAKLYASDLRAADLPGWPAHTSHALLIRAPEATRPAMRCSSCHQNTNFDPARVPGHPEWHLAPREMAWEGKSAAEICAQIWDPAQNGGRKLEDLMHHIGADTLVGWAWAPGFGRTPAPGTQQQAGALVEAWIKDGAVCPGR